MNPERYVGLAIHTAVRFCERRHVRGHDRDDAVQEACLAMIQACGDFDVSRSSGTGYLRQRILWRLTDWLTRWRRQCGASLEVWRETLMVFDPEPTGDVAAVLDRVGHRGAYVLRRIYWDGLPLAQIGAELGVTKQMVSLLHRRALAELADMFG